MLRFVNLTLSNPGNPGIAALPVQSIVTDGDFGLSMDAKLIKKLSLAPLAQVRVSRAEADAANSYEWHACAGPVEVQCGGRKALVNPISCASGVVIGRQLARQLLLCESTATSRKSAKMTPDGIFDLLTQERSINKIMIRERVVDEKLCNKIKQHATGQERIPTHVIGADGKGYLRKDIRDSFKINTQAIDPDLRQMMHDIFTQYVEPFYGVEVEWWEPPFLLLYTQGGHYIVHSDYSDRWQKEAGDKQSWSRVLDRDISVVVYLNDDFTGGALDFPEQGICLQPKSGTLVAFPATDRYKHGAKPTESGHRIALVTWAVVKGSPRAHPKPKNRVFMEEFRQQ